MASGIMNIRIDDNLSNNNGRCCGWKRVVQWRRLVVVVFGEEVMKMNGDRSVFIWLSNTTDDGILTTDHGIMTTDHARITTEHSIMTTDHVRITIEHVRITTDHVRITTEHGIMTTDHVRMTTDDGIEHYPGHRMDHSFYGPGIC